MLGFDAPAHILNSNSMVPPDAAGRCRYYGLPLLAADRPRDSGSQDGGRDTTTRLHQARESELKSRCILSASPATGGGGAGQQPSGGEATMEEQQLRALLHDLDALKQRPDDPTSIDRVSPLPPLRFLDLGNLPCHLPFSRGFQFLITVTLIARCEISAGTSRGRVATY
uniref:Uncharacterized protein n=1 Tax=Setaria viridis TaxID=4556 RepID=A0A4U6TGW9_SETVI|nr:hypothetical protein SEVIR_8G086300v2 [Setaria viridis]